MKIRGFALFTLSALFLAAIMAAGISQTAFAQCYNAAGQPVSCPGDKQKRPLPTTPPTAAPQAGTVCQPPSADQLASLCAALPAAAGGNTNAGGNSGPQDPAASHEGAQPHMFTLTDLELGGAGGILVGLLIGLLLPAVRGLLLPAVRGNLTDPAPGGGSASMFDKDRKVGDGFLKYEDGFGKVVPSGQGSIDWGDSRFGKVMPSDQNPAGMVDGSARNLGDQFIKGDLPGGGQAGGSQGGSQGGGMGEQSSN